jgi:hypothetical protein
MHCDAVFLKTFGGTPFRRDCAVLVKLRLCSAVVFMLWSLRQRGVGCHVMGGKSLREDEALEDAVYIRYLPTQWPGAESLLLPIAADWYTVNCCSMCKSQNSC